MMQPWRRAVLCAGSASLTMLFGLIPALTDAAAAPARWSRCGTWQHVSPPETVYGFPRDIEVVSPTETWFVGWNGFVTVEPVVRHWQGTRWERESFPTPDGHRSDVDIADLAVTAAGTVWGVGHADRVAGGIAGLRPLAARWTGGRWQRVPVGIPRQASFNAVAAVPGTDRLWAVGTYGVSTWGVGGNGTFVARWNGERWHRVPSPSPGHESHFMDVVVVKHRVWAVGSFRRSGEQMTLAARWNGERWAVFRGPRGALQAADAMRPDALWAVGPGKDVEPQRALLRRWNGASWTTIRRMQEPSALLDTEVASPTDAWAVGYRGGFPYHPLVMRRHEGSWRVTRAPDTTGRFWAIAGTPNNLWALRWYAVGDSGRLDTYHRC
jgi:hypothetical protein